MPRFKNPKIQSRKNQAEEPAAYLEVFNHLARPFCWALQSLTDFLVADACFLCGRRHPSFDPELALGKLPPPAACLAGITVVSLFGIFPIENRPVCPRCAGQFETATGPGLIGWYDFSGRVTTREGDVFKPAEKEAMAQKSRESEITTGTRGRLWVAAPFKMNDSSLKLMHLVKFAGRRSLIPLAARAVVKALENDVGPRWLESVLVPVPMDTVSLRRRGFNQAEKLAFAVSGLAAVPVAPYALKKIRQTAPQSLTERRRRAGNVQGAFWAGGNSVRDRAVLLVDDLVTTGATAASCASVLIGAGARSVGVVCLATAL